MENFIFCAVWNILYCNCHRERAVDNFKLADDILSVSFTHETNGTSPQNML